MKNTLIIGDISELRRAYEKLGYIGRKATLKAVGYRRWVITIEKEIIGIYDLIRHTFVD